MKQTNKVKKIIAMIIVFLLAIVVQNEVHATLFSSRYGGRGYRPAGLYKDLVYDTGIYCLERNVTLFSPAEYYAVASRHIEGDKCNGITSSKNAIMAYILAGPDGGEKRYGTQFGSNGRVQGGSRQNAVWYYANTWLSSQGLGAYTRYGNGGYCDFMDNARHYANTINEREEIYVVDITIYKSRYGTQLLMDVSTGTKKQNGSITVTKKDANLNTNLRIGFKVQTKVDGKTYWLEQSGNTYNYKGSNGTTFYTDSGTKTLKNISLLHEYKVWETQAPNNNYQLSDQSGYDSNMKAVKLTDWVSLKNNINVKVNALNFSRVSISGYVWIDKIPKGSTTTNSLYDTTDSRLNKVAVNLINKKTGKPINEKPVYTNEKGEYRFDKKILYNDLNNYYVQFDYSGLTIDGRSGKEYIPVAYNSKDLNRIVKNGSRAIMDNVATKDTDLSGIAMTYAGTNNNYLKTYGLKALADNTQNSANERLYNNYELGNINLGIKPIYEPKYSLTEDLKYVKIVLNNHEYIYQYGKKGLENIAAAPQVSFQSPSIGLYERAIYPSAIYDLLEGKNTNGQIKVYVVYEMLINNADNHQEAELYKAQKLHITSLTNTFDTNRYELATESNAISGTDKNYIDLENKIKGDFAKWKVNGNTATYNEEITVDAGKGGLKYIQFRVKDDEIKRILDNQNGLNEKDPTRVHSNGYHEYTRNDYSWNNIPNLPKTQTHASRYQEDNDSAPYLRFKLGKERKISGTVFEDRVDMTGRKEGEVLGNGRFNQGENVVSGVIVELVSGNKRFEEADITKLYTGSQDKKTYTIQDAKMATGEDGTFTFEGVMPGDYYIRLTYGDGSQKIMNSDGTIVSIDEYKSTIVTSDAARRAFGFDTNNNGKEWYKFVDAKDYSLAIDSLSMRAAHNSGTAQSSMLAGTAVIDITIENTQSNFTSLEGEQKETFDGFNFGIIVQPKQRLAIAKKITNVKLTNTPNLLFSGNPETENMSGVTDLDGIKNMGSTYTRMEVEETNIYGSELTLTYNIEVINTSDLNYYETDEKYKGWYYMFGDSSHGTTVKLNVGEVIDTYDIALRYISNNNKVTPVDKTLSIKEWKLLERNENDNVTIEFNKILSTQDDDLDYTNEAKISVANNATAKADEGNTIAIDSLKYAKPVIIPEPSLTEAVVTTPTGSNIPLIIAISAISTLAILGIVAFGITRMKKRKK